MKTHNKHLPSSIALAMSVACLLGSNPVNAADWTCSGSDVWTNTSCWLGGVLPPAGDTVRLQQGGDTDRVVNYDNSFNPGVTFGSVRVDASGTGQMTLNQDQNYSLNASTLYVGRDGTGVMLQSDGANNFGIGYIGANSGSSGSYTLSGLGSALWDTLLVGNVGDGAFNQTGGSNTVGQLFIGSANGSNGTYTLDGGDLVVNGDSVVGRWGNGEFMHNAGTHTVNGDLYVGRKAGPIGSPVSGSYTLNGGSVSANRLEIGVIPPIYDHPTLPDVYDNVHEASVGKFTQNSGSVNISGDVVVSVSGGAIGEYMLHGGTLTALRVVNNDTFKYRGGTLTADVENHDLFSFFDPGLRTIDGSFTNVGETIYSQLSYMETKHGTVTLADGSQVAITQDLTLETGGVLGIELGAGFYSATDWITVGGVASIDGTLDLLSLLPGFDPIAGDSWTLLSATDRIGTFADVLFPVIPGWDWMIDYTDTEVILSGTASAVPVPAAVWLFGSGLIGLVSVARRRR